MPQNIPQYIKNIIDVMGSNNIASVIVTEDDGTEIVLLWDGKRVDTKERTWEDGDEYVTPLGLFSPEWN